MGRLFWKFFAFLWVAQLVTILGVGSAIWIIRSERIPEMPARGLPADFFSTDTLEITRPHPPKPLSVPLPLRPPLMPIIAGSVVSFLFAGLLAWYFSRPIRSLQSAFKALTNGQLDVRLGSELSHRKDELADLGIDFDRMAERLSNLIESQKHLLHDVSHELRSPLARLQAAADLLEQQPERSAEFIGRIHRDTERMDTLVGELLALARLNDSPDENMAHPVDLAEIINEVADRTYLEIEKKQCHLNTTAVTPAVVVANHELLCRALENVIRNAIKFSPERGEISVRVTTEAEPGWVEIEMTDEGPGVSEINLSKIFDPFSRDTNAGDPNGFGLGLNITRRIIEAHGGAVAAYNRTCGGLGIVIRLAEYSD